MNRGYSCSWEIFSAGRNGYDLPPHPGLLPWGKVVPSEAPQPIHLCQFFQDLETIPPLPKGEGWGEGRRSLETTNRARMAPRLLHAVLAISAGLSLASLLGCASVNSTKPESAGQLSR